jgi:hypothetical protein
MSALLHGSTAQKQPRIACSFVCSSITQRRRSIQWLRFVCCAVGVHALLQLRVNKVRHDAVLLRVHLVLGPMHHGSLPAGGLNSGFLMCAHGLLWYAQLAISSCGRPVPYDANRKGGRGVLFGLLTVQHNYSAGRSRVE